MLKEAYYDGYECTIRMKNESLLYEEIVTSRYGSSVMGCMTCKETQTNFTLHNGPVNFGVCNTSHAYFFSVSWGRKSGFPRSSEASHIKYLDVRHSYTAILAINFFLESFNLWRPLLMIALYHQTKTPISFWCKRGMNPRSLIQPSETLPVELTETHNSSNKFSTSLS